MALADVRTAKELGKVGNYRYAFVPCVDCGSFRWVALKRNAPRSYRCHSCANKRHTARFQETNPNWRGGRNVEKDGYVTCSIPKTSPYVSMADSIGRVREHRLVMAEYLGRPIETWEVVHHINRNRSDNRIENLELLPNAAHHSAITRMQRYISELENKVTVLQQELSQYKEVD